MYGMQYQASLSLSHGGSAILIKNGIKPCHGTWSHPVRISMFLSFLFFLRVALQGFPSLQSSFQRKTKIQRLLCPMDQ